MLSFLFELKILLLVVIQDNLAYKAYRDYYNNDHIYPSLTWTSTLKTTLHGKQVYTEPVTVPFEEKISEMVEKCNTMLNNAIDDESSEFDPSKQYILDNFSISNPITDKWIVIGDVEEHPFPNRPELALLNWDDDAGIVSKKALPEEVFAADFNWRLNVNFGIFRKGFSAGLFFVNREAVDKMKGLKGDSSKAHGFGVEFHNVEGYPVRFFSDIFHVDLQDEKLRNCNQSLPGSSKWPDEKTVAFTFKKQYNIILMKIEMWSKYPSAAGTAPCRVSLVYDIRSIYRNPPYFISIEAKHASDKLTYKQPTVRVEHFSFLHTNPGIARVYYPYPPVFLHHSDHPRVIEVPECLPKGDEQCWMDCSTTNDNTFISWYFNTSFGGKPHDALNKWHNHFAANRISSRSIPIGVAITCYADNGYGMAQKTFVIVRRSIPTTKTVASSSNTFKVITIPITKTAGSTKTTASSTETKTKQATTTAKTKHTIFQFTDKENVTIKVSNGTFNVSALLSHHDCHQLYKHEHAFLFFFWGMLTMLAIVTVIVVSYRLCHKKTLIGWITRKGVIEVGDTVVLSLEESSDERRR